MLVDKYINEMGFYSKGTAHIALAYALYVLT